MMKEVKLDQKPVSLRFKFNASKNCTKKGRYNMGEALDQLESYLEAHMFSNMVVYFCKRHACMHLGHDRFMTQEEIVRRENERGILHNQRFAGEYAAAA